MYNAPYRVLLPPSILEGYKDDNELNSRIKEYMESYSGYHVFKIENGFALCEKR